MKPLTAAPTSRPFASILVALLVMSVGLTAGTGCAHRSTATYAGMPRWAHPTMATTDMTGPAEARIRSIHEGAAGSEGTAGSSSGSQSGCGSN